MLAIEVTESLPPSRCALYSFMPSRCAPIFRATRVPVRSARALRMRVSLVPKGTPGGSRWVGG